MLGTCLLAQAQTHAVWHCSKQTALSDVASPVSMAQTAPEDTFQIASMSIDANVIGLTLRDIMDVYSGVPVRVSGRPLTACFINDQSNAGREMLEALGLNASTMSGQTATATRTFGLASMSQQRSAQSGTGRRSMHTAATIFQR
jgi:hypothetical protein